MITDLIKSNRSFRRFNGAREIERATLEELVNHARLSASTANLQPLVYYLANSQSLNAEIYTTLKWAGYLTDWDGPEPSERPTAYIVICHDTEVAIKNEFLWCDVGIASQSILLAARDQGLGGCIIASVDKARIGEFIKLPERYTPLVVIALGEPAERVELTEIGGGDSIKYYRDESGTHIVPKRKLADIVIS